MSITEIYDRTIKPLPPEEQRRLATMILDRTASEAAAPETGNAAALALLKAWREEDATDDPAEVRRAEEELAALKRSLNADRAAAGERLLFPE